MKKIIFSILVAFSSFMMSGQVAIVFRPMYGKQAVKWHDTVYASHQAGLIKFEKMKLYISAITFFEDDKMTWSEADSFHLLDSEIPGSFRLQMPFLPVGRKKTLRFNIGIDSLTNVSGAMGGDLDPINGMYWAWHSGYINLKLEGTCSACTSPKREFQFHLGGYQWPFNTLQSSELQVSNSGDIEIGIDLESFFNVAASGRDHIMSPCPEAVKLSETFRDCFFIEKK